MTRIRYSLTPVIVGLALAVGSCGREEPTAASIDRAPSLRSHRETVPAPTVVYGPATFTRDTGKPGTDSATFSAHAGDTLTFVLTSNSEHGLNVTVDVNGIRLFSSTGGRGLPDTIRAVARATNTVRVWMAGKPGSSLRIVATVPGQPEPVETRVLSVLYESSVLGAGPSGDTALALGSRVHYAFTPHAGFRRLRVVVDGKLASASGTLTMDRAHWIAASADTVIALDPTEQALAQRLRTVLTSSTPREDWRAYQAAVDQAVAVWGDEATVHLARMRYATIDPVDDLARLVRLDSALAGMITPIPWPSASAALREGSVQGAMQLLAHSRSALAEAQAGGREATKILLVNGISTSAPDVDISVSLLMARMALDAARFPSAATTVSRIYNSSLFREDSTGRVASTCMNATEDRSEFGGLRAREMRGVLAHLLVCFARATISPSNDITEMLRWGQGALSNDATIASEADFLSQRVLSYQRDSLRHVLVIGHSEGSLLTQLAVQRLREVYAFREASAPRCIGTVSIAGVGTANWPLSDRHSRFVVAKNDLVTLLPGSLRNTRTTVEDEDTRYWDDLLSQLRPVSGFHPLQSALYEAAKWFGGRRIHRLDRYLSSGEIWPIISNSLDDLYRTCAVGSVTVNPSTATVQLFGAAAFGATWRALDGQPLTTSDAVEWSVDSALATVSQVGRLVAGSVPGTVALQAKVRRTVGTAAVTIVDDSVRDLYQPPTVTVTERTLTVGPHPPGPTICEMQAITITASAMPGASITSVELYTRWTIPSDSVYYEHVAVPLDTELFWRKTSCTIGGVPAPWTYSDNWYRLVVTDSHGKFTEKIGPNP